jgi:tetratricopeptide (TPR) repeat protein
MTNNLTPSGDSLLKQLGINPHNLRADFPTREQRLHYRAVVQWLTDYKPKSDDTNLEKVRGYIESLHYLCQVRSWQQVQTVLNFPIIISTTRVNFTLPLSEHLMFKGLGANLLKVSQEIFESFKNERINLISILILKARAFEATGNLPETCDIYEKLCSELSVNSEMYTEVKAHLAMAQVQREFYKEGISNLITSLSAIEKFLDDHPELPSVSKFLDLKSDILSGIAYYTMNKGQLTEAKKQYARVLEIVETQRIFHKSINPLVHTGIILRKEFLIDESIKNLLKARERAIEIESEPSLVWIAHHLAWAYRMNKQLQKAECQCQISLQGYREMQDERGINDSYEQLGFICLDKGQNCDAIKNLNIAFKWRKKNRILQGAASCAMGLAIAYWRRGNLLKFVKTVFEGINLYRQAGVLNYTRISRWFRFANIFRNLLLKNK